MAGCEYLPNIERVGFNSAIKHFGKLNSFSAVMSFLRNHKIHKEKVPADYETNAKKVHDLFNF
jgi:hypothetical protein